MTNTDYVILVAWAKASHNLNASDVQCALAYTFGGSYDIATISVQDAAAKQESLF